MGLQQILKVAFAFSKGRLLVYYMCLVHMNCMFSTLSVILIILVFFTAFKKFGIPLGRLPDAKLFDDTKTELDEEVFEEVVVSNRDLGRVYELSFDSTPAGRYS